jgi:hypothetical protein
LGTIHCESSSGKSKFGSASSFCWTSGLVALTSPEPPCSVQLPRGIGGEVSGPTFQVLGGEVAPAPTDDGLLPGLLPSLDGLPGLDGLLARRRSVREGRPRWLERGVEFRSTDGVTSSGRTSSGVDVFGRNSVDRICIRYSFAPGMDLNAILMVTCARLPER